MVHKTIIPKQLPVYKIKGKFYFLDKRLNEYRNVKNPSDRLDFFDVGLDRLQKPTRKDSMKLEKMGLL
jgi:hypothetical protein